MKLNVYSYFNKAIGAYDTKMTFDDHEDKAVVYQIYRGLNARFVLGTYQDLRYLKFCKLGVFDDETGEFEADKQDLIDFDKEITLYENKLSKEQNGNSENS